jgi:hypothetical protein
MLFTKPSTTPVRVRFRVGIAGPDMAYHTGEVADLSPVQARGFCESGVAELAPPGAELGRAAVAPAVCLRCGADALPSLPWCAACLSAFRTGGRP